MGGFCVLGTLAFIFETYIAQNCNLGRVTMDSARLVELGLALLPGFVLFTLVYTIAVKILERRLTFVQSLYISAVAVVILLAFIVAYTFAKVPLRLGRDVESFVYIAGYLITGIVITRLARNYGVEKKGWLGLGGRANLWILVASWVVIVVVLVVKYFIDR